MDIGTGVATDHVLAGGDRDLIVIRLSRAARVQVYALTYRARDRIIRHHRPDLIVIGDFVRRALEAAEAATDPEAKQRGILYGVALNAGVQAIARTVTR